MKSPLRFLGWALLVGLLVLSVALVLAAASMAGAMDHAVIHIDGETISLAQLDAGHWLVAVGGVTLALLIVVLVVPLAVLVPLAIVLVALVGALLAVAGVLAMLCSPLILLAVVVWLMVRLIRRNGAKRVGTGATITG